jgi:hypothetical protein
MSTFGNEATDNFKGKPDDDQVSQPISVDAIKNVTVKFCGSISIGSAEPGVFVVHVPGIKICLRSTLPHVIDWTVIEFAPLVVVWTNIGA